MIIHSRNYYLLVPAFLLCLTSTAFAAPKVSGLHHYRGQGPRISQSKIRSAMKNALLYQLQMPKTGWRMSVAEANHIDVKSIKLKQINIKSPLGPTENRVEARFSAKVDGKKETIYMRTAIDLAKDLPQFKARVKAPNPNGGIRLKSFSTPDPSTVYWVD